MRSRLAIAAVALMTLLIVDVGLRLAADLIPEASRWSLFETHVKSRQIAGLDPESDIVFLGSSITAAGIDPELLGSITGVERIYNAGIPGATPVSQETWLERVVLASTRPGLVVIGVLPFPVAGDGEPYNTEIERAAFAEKLSSYLEFSALVTKQGVFADWDILAARERLEELGYFTESGHFKGFYERSGEDLEGVFRYDESGWLNDTQLAALGQMVELARSLSSDVVVMIEPGHPDGIADSVIESYNTSMHLWAEDNGVELWDAWSVAWSDDLFGDEVHFNRDGTIAFTRYIADLITNRGHA